jgi:histidine triad (HIT) family protein
MSCIFCQIANREAPGTIIYEDEKFVAFKNIAPKARIHDLIIPRKHINSVNHLEKEDAGLVGEMFLIAKKIAKQEGIADTGYSLIFNTGKDAGQTVEHLHLHILGGEQLQWG